MLEHTKFLQREQDERSRQTEGSTEKILREIQQELQAQAKRIESVEENIRKFSSTALNTQPFRKIGEKYYYFEERLMGTWSEAENYCLSVGGHLASVQSKSEIDALVEQSIQHFYWLDLNDLSVEGQFRSATTGKNATYLNWAPNEPNDASNDEDCVILVAYNKNNNMNDENCKKLTHFICEKEFH